MNNRETYYKVNNYSQTYLASLLGCTQPNVTNILKGRTPLRANQIKILLEEYDDLDIETCLDTEKLNHFFTIRRKAITKLISERSRNNKQSSESKGDCCA